MMPGAADRVADQQPLCERAAVMRARRSDRKDFARGSRDEHRILADMAEEHGAVVKLPDIDTLREVRTSRRRRFSVHDMPLQMAGEVAARSQ